MLQNTTFTVFELLRKTNWGGGIYPPTQISVKFWSIERNIENTIIHLYFNEENDYYKENTCENEVFRSTIGRYWTYSRFSCWFITCSMRIENLDWSRWQKQPLEVLWEKKKFFKVLQNSQDTPVPEETPVNFANFLRAPLLQNNSRRPLLKCGHFSNEARDIDRICCRELIPEREGSISPSSFYRDLPGY